MLRIQLTLQQLSDSLLRQPYLTQEHLQMLAKKVSSVASFKNMTFSFRRGVHGPNAAARGAALVLISNYIYGL